MRALFGLATLPRGMALDDPRLPAVSLGQAPLRLNTHPVPPAILADSGSGHDAHVAALTRWLAAQAGDWAAGRRRLITDYLAFAAAEVAREHEAIQAHLARYDGLYVPEDYFWSALRPLPRAWIVAEGQTPRFAELAFWDGTAIHAGPFEPQSWPAPLRRFWRDEPLPRSPFRRPSIASIP